jgi:type VI secretion system protein ImpH
MEGDERPAPDRLRKLGRLVAEPSAFHLFQALRLIEAAYADTPRLGRSVRPAQDPVRIGQQVELAFPPVTVTAFAAKDPEGKRPGRLRQLFFGLFGPMGPLPLHVTEYARDRERNQRDTTLVGFADAFHHRATSLLYRAWASAEPAPSFDRPDDDPFAEHVAAFAGRRGAAFRNRDAMPDLAKLHFAGRLLSGAKNEEGLLAIVSAFFRAPCRIESFVGSWLELDARDRWQLGVPAQLGRSASLGARVWSRQAKFRLRIGPLSLREYRRLLPGRASLRRLASVVRNYHGDSLDWDLNLVLAKGEAPALQLGGQAQLGWTTWIGSAAREREADDLRLHPTAVAQ